MIDYEQSNFIIKNVHCEAMVLVGLGGAGRAAIDS